MPNVKAYKLQAMDHRAGHKQHQCFAPITPTPKMPTMTKGMRRNDVVNKSDAADSSSSEPLNNGLKGKPQATTSRPTSAPKKLARTSLTTMMPAMLPLKHQTTNLFRPNLTARTPTLTMAPLALTICPTKLSLPTPMPTFSDACLSSNLIADVLSP